MNTQEQELWWVTDYGIRNRAGYICAVIKPTRYLGQDDRYREEVEERDFQVRLMVAAPKLLNVAQDFDEALGELGLHCNCGEPDCRTTRLREVLKEIKGASV